MSKLVGMIALVVTCLVCSVADAVPRRVTIVRRQRIVQPRAQAVIVERPLQLIAPAVIVPQQQIFVPRQQLFFFGF